MPAIKAVRVGDDEYSYDPRSVTLQELTQLKVQAGLTMSDMLGGNLDDPRVWIAMIWLARRRPTEVGGGGEFRLQYADVDAKFSDIDLIFEDDEEPSEESPTVATPNGSDGSPSITPDANGTSTNEDGTA